MQNPSANGDAGRGLLEAARLCDNTAAPPDRTSGRSVSFKAISALRITETIRRRCLSPLKRFQGQRLRLPVHKICIRGTKDNPINSIP